MGPLCSDFREVACLVLRHRPGVAQLLIVGKLGYSYGQITRPGRI
jgi:hypothetical protein